jgi:hypothetical protein
MNVFEESGRTIQLAFEGGQRIAHAMMARPARSVSRFKERLRMIRHHSRRQASPRCAGHRRD